MTGVQSSRISRPVRTKNGLGNLPSSQETIYGNYCSTYPALHRGLGKAALIGKIHMWTVGAIIRVY